MRMSPFFFPMILPNMAAAAVSRYLGAQGYNSTATTACAASNQAIGEALEVIRRGAADVVFAGGTEAGISLLGLSGFAVMRALSTRNEMPEEASRPFDADRDGFVPSEGSVVLVMESLEHALDRGANILAEVAGFGSTSDAGHPVQPQESGASAAQAMSIALADAGSDDGRCGLHQRSRHVYPAERYPGDRGYQTALRGRRLPDSRQLHQVHDRPFLGRGRGIGSSGLHQVHH